MEDTQSKKLAVLVDADNAQPTSLVTILQEVAKYGISSVKRAYGDWTTPNLAGWKEQLHVHAVQPIQQFSYTKGKNATDSALIIDAMDLLHGGNVDGFCLVSSDSDFTRLATRIRESGMVVYGFGQQKTPEPFVKACDKFVYTEILAPDDVPAKPTTPATTKTSKQADKKPTQTKQKPIGSAKQLKTLLTSAIEQASQDDGWAFLGAVGSHLTKLDPSFDSRNYGQKKLGDLVKSQSYVELKKRNTNGESGSTQMYVRLK